MAFFPSFDDLEEREEQLRSKVFELPEEKRKLFYKKQNKLIKDPDTYAALNYFFLGGLHHFYLGRYVTFAIEIVLLIIAILLLISGNMFGLAILFAVGLYELPQLFFSQKIARLYNLNMSLDLYSELNEGSMIDTERKA